MKNPMNKYKTDYFLTDGGLETTLIFHRGLQLNHFSAFELLNDEKGQETLAEYYRPYLQLAQKFETGFIAETPTWRSNPDWGSLLGYQARDLERVNKEAIRFVRSLAGPEYDRPFLCSGNIGPRGDGYRATSRMLPNEARNYHEAQIRTFALSDADLVTAMTMNYTEEAIGIVAAAKSCDIPVVISFSVETDGRLPGGETLEEAILRTDDATDGYALYFMVNCAHPDHFKHLFQTSVNWKSRIGGIRANASMKSHAELDECDTLDTGDALLLAQRYQELDSLLPNLKVVGGCCGTDHSHIEQIFSAMRADITDSLGSGDISQVKRSRERVPTVGNRSGSKLRSLTSGYMQFW